jgi:hypothetical protein
MLWIFRPLTFLLACQLMTKQVKNPMFQFVGLEPGSDINLWFLPIPTPSERVLILRSNWWNSGGPVALDDHHSCIVAWHQQLWRSIHFWFFVDYGWGHYSITLQVLEPGKPTLSKWELCLNQSPVVYMLNHEHFWDQQGTHYQTPHDLPRQLPSEIDPFVPP